jgi:hypothetical protein
VRWTAETSSAVTSATESARASETERRWRRIMTGTGSSRRTGAVGRQSNGPVLQPTVGARMTSPGPTTGPYRARPRQSQGIWPQLDGKPSTSWAGSRAPAEQAAENRTGHRARARKDSGSPYPDGPLRDPRPDRPTRALGPQPRLLMRLRNAFSRSLSVCMPLEWI